MNKTFLVGRLTNDPDLRYINDNTPICTFTMAINRQYSNAQGEKEADYINVVVWRKQAENVKKYCAKGALVGVDGSIQTRTYDDKDGKKVYVTEVVANNVSFLGSKTTQENQEGQATDVTPYSDLHTKTTNAVDLGDEPFADFGESVVLREDDIAF